MNWKKGIALSLVATMAFAGLTGCTDSPYAPDDVTPQNHNSASALVHPGDFASTLSNGIYIMQIKNSAISDNPITLITIKDTSFREGYFGQDMVDDSYIPNRPADAGNSSVSVWNIMDDSVLGIAGQGINRISIIPIAPCTKFGEICPIKNRFFMGLFSLYCLISLSLPPYTINTCYRFFSATPCNCVFLIIK